MEDQKPADNISVWGRYREALNDYVIARNRLFTEVDSSTRIELIRTAFEKGDRYAALDIAQFLPESELQTLMPELLACASYYNGFTNKAQAIILSLPHNWLVEHIKQYSEYILERGDEQDYTMILDLFSKIDKHLALKLVQDALENENADIREVGKIYQDKLQDVKT
jgi:hypothetical protein